MTPLAPTIPLSPATPTPKLLEASFSDLITAAEQAKDLSDQTPTALGLLGAADRQMAQSPCCGHSRPLAGGADFRGATAPCPGRRDVQRPSRTTARTSERRCVGSARSRACRNEVRAFRPSGRVSCSNWKGQFASGSTIWLAIARPDALDRRRSTMRYLTSIGAIAPRTRAGQRTIPPNDLWCGPGMAVRLRWTDCRCSA